MMLHFKDPSKLRTKKVVFEDVYLARDSGTLEQLKELSSKRVNVESINENSSVTEAIAREMSGGLTSQSEQDVQKIEQYLPLLENLVHHVDLVSDNPQVIHWTSDLKIRWTSALTSSSIFKIKGRKFFQIDNLRFELGMILFLYGAMLREWASEVLGADLVQSATLFRKAAGVYQYLAHEVLPSLQSALILGPPEATSSVSSVMSFICLTEAQIVAIMKAEEKGNAGLLAKLHYGIVQLLDEARVISCSALKECKDLSSRFMDFIPSCKVLHELRSYKYFAQAQKTDGQIGIAIGLLRRALSNVQKNLAREESWRVVIKQEREALTVLLGKYEHENDFVWREKIPLYHELPLLQGKKIVSSIPYHPQRWVRPLALKI